MGEQRNLTKENVEVLEEKLEAMKKDNPDLTYRFFKQDEEHELQPSNRKIFEKLEAIERQLKLVFDGHVLINGAFQRVDVANKSLNSTSELR